MRSGTCWIDEPGRRPIRAQVGLAVASGADSSQARTVAEHWRNESAALTADLTPRRGLKIVAKRDAARSTSAEGSGQQSEPNLVRAKWTSRPPPASCRRTRGTLRTRMSAPPLSGRVGMTPNLAPARDSANGYHGREADTSFANKRRQ